MKCKNNTQCKMDSNRQLILLFLIYMPLKASKGSRSFDIRWTKTNCTIIDASVIQLFRCPIKELAKNRGNYLQVYFQSKQNIEQVTIDFRVIVPAALNRETELLKFRTDACKLTTFQGKNPLVTSIFKNFLKDTTFPKNCPIRANYTYAMEHFALNPDFFPGYTPEMNFSTIINLFTEKRRLIYVNMATCIVKRRKIK